MTKQLYTYWQVTAYRSSAMHKVDLSDRTRTVCGRTIPRTSQTINDAEWVDPQKKCTRCFTIRDNHATR